MAGLSRTPNWYRLAPAARDLNMPNRFSDALPCLRLESSDRTARVVHQEAANEIILISEALCHHIVGREEEPRIFYSASANHNC